jgi:MerR family transcriptional regulator, redox-sensitive transcriptional activator SoxR
VHLQVGLKSSSLLTIGEVARRSGRAASSIRYYEAIGLLAPAVRVSGHRRYDPEVVRRLAVIDTAQRAGLTLDEVRLLLEAAPEDPASTERLRAVAERKLPELRTLIERAELVRDWLEDAARCTCPTLDDCPLFDEPTRLPPRDERRKEIR